MLRLRPRLDSTIRELPACLRSAAQLTLRARSSDHTCPCRYLSGGRGRCDTAMPGLLSDTHTDEHNHHGEDVGRWSSVVEALLRRYSTVTEAFLRPIIAT